MRIYTSDNTYRYGFNGKEKDSDGEFGSNTTYDYGFRVYNPAIGKFLSVDPIARTYSHLPPYNFADNEPIAHIDLWGLQKASPEEGKNNLIVVIMGVDPNEKIPEDGATQATKFGKNGLGGISNAFSGTTNQVVTFKSSLTSNTRLDAGETIIDFKAANPDGKVILVGHSLGALNARGAAAENEDVDVSLLVQLDGVTSFGRSNIPSGNVSSLINITQNNEMPMGPDAFNNGETNVQNFTAKNSTYTSIDEDFVGSIIQIISNLTNVIPNQKPKMNSPDEIEKN